MKLGDAASLRLEGQRGWSQGRGTPCRAQFLSGIACASEPCSSAIGPPRPVERSTTLPSCSCQVQRRSRCPVVELLTRLGSLNRLHVRTGPRGVQRGRAERRRPAPGHRELRPLVRGSHLRSALRALCSWGCLRKVGTRPSKPSSGATCHAWQPCPHRSAAVPSRRGAGPQPATAAVGPARPVQLRREPGFHPQP